MNTATSEDTSSTQLISSSLQKAARLSKRKAYLNGRIERITARLKLFQNWRLISAGVFFVLLAILTTRPNLRLELPLVIVFVLIFSYLVARTSRFSRHLRRLKGLHSFLSRQENRLRGKLSGRNFEAALRASETAHFPRDIGLIGPLSLWTLIDETLTDGGQLRLLEWMTRPPLPTTDILRRQKQIQSLRRESWFFTRLTIEASSSEFRLSSQQILKFLAKPFAPDNFAWVAFGNVFAWIVMITMCFVSLHNGWRLEGVFFGAFVVLSFISLMKNNSPFMKGVGLSHHLSLLAPIFEALEKRATFSSALREFCPVTQKAGPSRQTRKLNLVLAFMSVQANPIVYFVVNALLPWSITATYFLERRRKKIAYTFPQCLDELAEIEALASLVLLDHYQTKNYPEMTDSSRKPQLQFTDIFHPLIDRERVVANDFAFQNGKSIGLLTGSNMSGKSTFLRTVGLNQTLANMGAPVFAKDYQATPMKIETCIEVSDSLRDGFSYFYAEVRRLRDLLQAAKRPEPMLFLIDEIFRGTNNRERHVGSRAVIRALADAATSIGFVSTHDLELTSLETTSPSLLNLHFREDFSDAGEMVFHYHLRHGPCPTTNALKIMRNEGINVDEV